MKSFALGLAFVTEVQSNSEMDDLTFLFVLFLTERDRETIEELSAALRDEKARAEQIQLALTNERRQTEALKHVKDRADQLRNVNKGNLVKQTSSVLYRFSHGKNVMVHVFSLYKYEHRLGFPFSEDAFVTH